MTIKNWTYLLCTTFLGTFAKMYLPQNEAGGMNLLLMMGADIERIRSVWNRYCDGETEFLYLGAIFVRMVDRYGNVVSDVVKLEDIGRKKILSKCIILEIKMFAYFS